MFVGEAPGFHEDKQGYPFVGQAGKLLDQLLGGIGLSREDVYIANVIKCRPPGNRDPQPDEIEACESHLFRQVELIQPKLVGDARQLRHEAPVRASRPGSRASTARSRRSTLGGRAGAALPALPPGRRALHARDAGACCEEDFARIPELLGRVVEPPPEPEPLLVAPSPPSSSASSSLEPTWS